MNLDPKQQEALLGLAMAVKLNPLLFWKPSLKQSLLIDTDHPRVLLRAANQAGKTEAGAAKVWHYARQNPGSIILVVAANHKSKVEVVGAKLAALAPLPELLPGSDYNPTRGWRNDVVQMRNGSRIIFRSAESQATSIAGLTAHAVWIDEPPPQHLWGEILSRVAVHNGPVWITMTPIGRSLEWLRTIIEGDPTKGIEPQEDWLQITIELSPKDCPWRTQESIDAQCASYGPWEYAQRALGAWEGVTPDRMFPAFTESLVVSELPQGHTEWSVGLGMDHGIGAGHEACVLILWSLPLGRMIVWDEYVNETATTPEVDAGHIMAMLARHQIRPQHVDLAYGDTNAAGKAQPGAKINDMMELHMAPIHIRNPDKRTGSVDHGVRMLHLAMQRGHFQIHPRCKSTIKSLRHWQGKDDDLKHILDALRYVSVPVLTSMYDPHTLDRLQLLRA